MAALICGINFFSACFWLVKKKFHQKDAGAGAGSQVNTMGEISPHACNFFNHKYSIQVDFFLLYNVSEFV